MSGDSRSAVRVGLLVMGALTLAGVAVFLLGEKQNLFRAKNHYYVRLASANGLQVGAAVQLNGVNVGQVVKITLPEDMGETQLQVRLAIDARYEQRIRADSQARIKTLGLLGDKFVEVTSGSPSAPAIAEEGEIPSAPTTNLEQIVSSGEDLMVNVLAISSQLAAILSRMERGEGLLGELTKDVEPGKKMTTELYATLGALRKAAEKIEGGKGPVPRLLGDEALGAKLASSVDRLDSILAKAESGDGVVAALLSDPAQKQKLERAFDSFERAAATVSKLADRLDESEALLPKLLADEQYGKKVAADLERLLGNLAVVSEKLAHGQGTAARLIDDPALFEAINDIVIGVNESKFLRWLIRSRQEKGIEKRYDDARERGEAPPPSQLPER